ncbi:MAG: hypothetical protein ACW98U_11725 [Candidatus Thorarchaeota archaeon]|jgi:hypothetical protein
MTKPFSINLCSDGAAFEVKPKKRVKLDLTSFSKELTDLLKMKIRVSLPVILILEGDDGQSLTIYPSGRILLRKFPSEESVRHTAEVISPILFSGGK